AACCSLRVVKPTALFLVVAFLVGCSSSDQRAYPAAPSALQHQSTIRSMPTSVQRLGHLIEQASFRHGVDANLLAIASLLESGGDPLAASPRGAMGLMQIMPATAEAIARARGVFAHVAARLFDPAYNIDFGAYYLSRQL